jgi:hypothetical protein
MNWIRTYDIVPRELCRAYRRLIDTSPAATRMETEYRRCTQLVLATDDANFALLREYLRTALDRYKAEVPHNGNLNFCTHLETPSGFRYDPNGRDHFHLHADNWNAESSLRQVSVVVYLNGDADEDGPTIFPVQDVRIVPVEGRVALFPAFYTYPHRAETPARLGKYVIITWLCYAPASTHYTVVPLTSE